MPRARLRGRGVGRAGRSRSIDEVGELVITEPMPSMPLFFWGDEDGERLRESYFSMFPGVWRHGDWIEITPRGSAIIYGRSDSTINREGVRMGTSEIYRAALAVPEVLDALVVDIPPRQRDGELWMILFVVLAEGSDARRRARRRDQAPRSARTARRGTSPTRCCRSRRCRARSRASCSRCRSSGS